MTQADFEVAPNKTRQMITQPVIDDDVAGLRKLIGAYDRLLDQFMPPSILVDENWMVIDTFAGAGRYLRLRSRRPTKSILELSCEPIRSALRSAIDRLCSGEHPVAIGPITVYNESGDEEHLRVTVSTVPLEDEHDAYYSIVLEPLPQSVNFHHESSSFAVRETLEAEPDSTAELGCDSGTTLGNSFSANVLDQILEASQLAAVVLDADLRIQKFTPQAARMFHLVEHDIGREIRTFVRVLEVADLVDRIRAVVHTGDSDEVEIHLHHLNQYFVARISPFRNQERIEGAILTVVDLSRMESRKQEVRMLSSIVQSSDDAIVGRDRENRIVTWNAAAEELFGYSALEAIGKDISLIVPPGQEADYSQTLRLLQKGGHLDHFDSIRQTKCGRLIKVSVRLSPIYDDDHRLVGMSTIERDISRQSELFEKLTASERKFQDFYHQSPDMYCSVDANTGTIVDCNERMCQRLHLSRTEIIGRPMLDLHSSSTRENARICIDQFRSCGEVNDQELELVRGDGSTIPVSLNMSAIRDETGRIVRSRSVWRDMSSQKQKEEQVRQSELRYRNSFQNSAIGIAQVGLDGRYLMTNRRICEIVGYSQEELSELRFSDITHPDDLPEESVLREELIAGRAETYKIEKRYIHKQGQEVWASLFVSLERDAEGKPLACHSYIEDISSRKELESELRLAISQRDQFLAMLSHELRNPLGAILNTCAVLHRGRGLPKTMQQPVSIVTRQARQMAELLDDLLDVSRITTGKIKLEKSPVILTEIVDEAFESQQGLAAARQQRLLITYADDPLHIFGDRSRLVQVVVNLLNNAIKYSSEGAVIKVTLEKKGRIAVIRVKDSGVGIEPELIESLFEMFAQKDSTLDRSGGGMGLGLHLVRKLVGFHGGRVYGRSEGVGKGSEFVVELPLSSRVRTALTAKTRLKDNKPSMPPIEKIVVVEDIADARNMLVALLEADDYEVSSAADGEAGLSLILREKPDLAIVDIGLPKMDGYEVARRVRAQLSSAEITLIALSGYGQDSDHDRALAAGFDMHMVKPLNTARLEKILSR
jgi:PAS domain S-box-containing protein